MVVFPNSVGSHGDLILALYVLTWTMYSWWNLCKISILHFDVQSFVSKMYMAMPSTSNRQNSYQHFWESISQFIFLSLAWNKIFFFLLNLIINWMFIDTLQLTELEDAPILVKEVLAEKIYQDSLLSPFFLRCSSVCGIPFLET